MKPTLDIQLVGLSQTLRDRIKARVNEFIEQKDIWQDMWAVNEYEDEDGRTVLFIRIPFFKALKRDAFRDKIKSKVQEIWSKCEVGSYIALHKCDHDGSTRRGCQMRKILEKREPELEV